MERKIVGDKRALPQPSTSNFGKWSITAPGLFSQCQGAQLALGCVWRSHETLIKIQELPSAPSPKTISLDSRKIQAELRRSPLPGRDVQ